jgi:hypothetical protein
MRHTYVGQSMYFQTYSLSVCACARVRVCSCTYPLLLNWSCDRSVDPYPARACYVEGSDL